MTPTHIGLKPTHSRFIFDDNDGELLSDYCLEKFDPTFHKCKPESGFLEFHRFEDDAPEIRFDKIVANHHFPTEELTWKALEHNPLSVFLLFPDQGFKFCLLRKDREPDSMAEDSDDDDEEEEGQDPLSALEGYSLVEAPTKEMIEYVIKEEPQSILSLAHFMKPSEDLLVLALQDDGMLLCELDRDLITPKMVETAVASEPFMADLLVREVSFSSSLKICAEKAAGLA